MATAFEMGFASGVGGPSFLVEDYKALQHAVDGFGVMTYDYSHPMSPGPNAPIDWVTSCVENLLDAGGLTTATCSKPASFSFVACF